ncbi:MAG: GGDEF domain-containing protein [Desulfocapsaceae bacterium]|nr:GGDEF domain-containing protein [Desulfocapsaceae bacterium]
MHLPQPIEEFLRAVRKPYSYDVFHNIYTWFGFLWGLPIPLVTCALQFYLYNSVGQEQDLAMVVASPVQWFFFAHPPLFALIFGVLGTIRAEKDEELARSMEKLKEISIHDPLTGLKNRRYFSHIFHDECARSLRKNEPLSLLFLDIDHFKRINDTHGHFFGDLVLKKLGGYLLEHCRPYDTAVRWGGEEFLLLLISADEQSAKSFAERLRSGVEAEMGREFDTHITISIGLSEYQQNDTLESITDRADQALYHAKNSGRNRVVPWSTLPGEKSVVTAADNP